MVDPGHAEAMGRALGLAAQDEHVRTIRVLPVGDAACSVVRDLPARYSLGKGYKATIIDGGRKGAAKHLAAELSAADWRALSELVITHWDADHWEGLLALASRLPKTPPGLSADLTIYSPAVATNAPPHLASTLASFIRAASPTGVDAIDLKTAWQRLCPNVKVKPRAEGQVVPIAGRDHKVVWPPRTLDPVLEKRAHNLVKELREVAKHYPGLEEAMDEAYEPMFGPVDETDPNGNAEMPPLAATDDEWHYFSDETQSTPGAQEDGAEEVADDDGEEFEDEDAFWNDINAGWNVRVPTGSGRAPKPTPRILNPTKYERKLIERARALQNDLSLVFHDEEQGSLLVYGDAPSGLVRSLNLRLRNSYRVLLAPHHGTIKMPGPSAWFCIAQCGTDRFVALWKKNHVHGAHSLSSNCLSVGQGPGFHVNLDCP
jgi:hypothetical protein